MIEYYCSENGSGLHDGSSEANAWTVAEIDWTSVCLGSNTLYIAGTITSTLSVGKDPGPDNTLTISGAVMENPGAIDGGGKLTKAVSIFKKQGVTVESLTFRNPVADDSDASIVYINNSQRITVRDNRFDGTEQTICRGILIHCPNNCTVADIVIDNNTFYKWGIRNPLSNEGACVRVSYFAANGTYLDGLVVSNNTAFKCNMLYRMHRSGGIDKDTEYPVGVQIFGNILKRCEHAIQQVSWMDGDGDKPSFIAYNKIFNTGRGGKKGTKQLNVIQVSSCTGGAIYRNLVDGWEKLDTDGDGFGIMIDWSNGGDAEFSRDMRIYDNELTNGGKTTTKLGMSMAGVCLYRAKDCRVYNNYIHDTRGGLSLRGNESIPENSQGNIFNDNIVMNIVRYGFDADVNTQGGTVRNNTIGLCGAYGTRVSMNCAVDPVIHDNLLYMNTANQGTSQSDTVVPVWNGLPNN